MDHTSSNGMSVMAIEKDNCRMVGVLTTRDVSVTIREFDDKYTDDSLGLTAFVSLSGELRKGAAAKVSIETGDPVAHFWCLAVDPEYKDNKIANNLIRGALELLKGTSYKYATIGAFNYFTKRAAECNGFEAVHSITVKDFLWKGAPIY